MYKQLPKYVTITILSGIIFIILSWVIDILIRDIEFSLSGISYMHKSNPLHSIIYLTWIILSIVIYYVVKYFEKEKSELKYIIDKKNESINKNTLFADKIGKGDFSANIDNIDKKDTLQNSLLLMRDNLITNINKEAEQNWIAKGRDIISNILRLNNNIEHLAYDVLNNVINYSNIIQGAFYLYDEDNKIIKNIATYAYNRKRYINQEFKIGQGLIGQAAYEMDIIYRTEIPDNYVTIKSGILGDKKPSSILILPLISDEKLQGIIELASIDDEISELEINFFKKISAITAQAIFNLKANLKTEQLLKESQKMTKELKKNEEKLQENAEQMQVTQKELEKLNNNLIFQIEEVENAQKRLHSLLENASEVISIYDEKGIVKYESPSAKSILGYSPEDIIGKNGFERVSSNANDSIKKAFSELLKYPDKTTSTEFEYKKKQGDVIWLESLGRNLLNNTAINGIIFNTRDITSRKIAENEQKMRTQMQALSENSPDMIIRLGTNEQFLYINPVVENYTGIDPNNIINKTLNEVDFDEHFINVLKETIEKISISPEKIETEFTFPSKIGERIMQVNAIPEFNEEKKLTTILFVAHDITQAKRIELEIQETNNKITESINYAERIQTAILPDTKQIQKNLPNSFIFFRPKDIISGDFPWFYKKQDDIFIAAVDCTGHGVPGALLSFIGYFLLNNIADQDSELTPGELLDILHFRIRKILKQDIENAKTQDGMDVALCKINFSKNQIQYAGAHRPLYLFRNGEIILFKGDKKAIGGMLHRLKAEENFKNYVIDIETNDKIFFFSDGLPDQIGGENKSKYSSKRIKQAILNHPDFTMPKYFNYFARDFNTFKGDYKQIDDVLLIGIEF